MKLMSWNAHAFSPPNREEKLRIFADFLRSERPDAVALQEVAQRQDAPSATASERLKTVGTVPPKEENDLLCLLDLTGELYDGAWLGVKLGYGVWDEGVGILCRYPVSCLCPIWLTPNLGYENWRRRAALTLRCESLDTHLCSVHFGWWEDGFLSQWRILKNTLDTLSSVWVMGDFNVSANRSELAQNPLFSDYPDAYRLAEVRDGEATVLSDADGWRGRSEPNGRLRIDQIRCRPARKIARYRRVLDGRQEPMISDHFGILIETEEN